MKLIIEISEEDFEKAKHGRAGVSVMRKAITNGVPLDQLRFDIAGLDQNYRAYADYVRASVVSRIIKIIDGYSGDDLLEVKDGLR